MLMFIPLLLMASWTVHPYNTRYFVSASLDVQGQVMFPSSEFFTLRICPAYYARDYRVWELECQCKGVKEWMDSRAIVEVWLPQLYCSSYVMVSLDLLELSWRRRFFKPKKRVMFFRTRPRRLPLSPPIRKCSLLS